MPQTHVVRKRIPGVDAEPGDKIDASGWRLAKQLESQRYITPLARPARRKSSRSRTSANETEEE